MSENGNKQAYPLSETSAIGLTKRELFAAMMMQGFCHHEMPCTSRLTSAQQRAQLAIENADALLAELEKKVPAKCYDDVRNVVENGGNNVISVMLVTAIYGTPPIQRWQWQTGTKIWSPEFLSREAALEYADLNKLNPMPFPKV
jgi:Tfp pilus assembly protein PilX